MSELFAGYARELAAVVAAPDAGGQNRPSTSRSLSILVGATVGLLLALLKMSRRPLPPAARGSVHRGRPRHPGPRSALHRLLRPGRPGADLDNLTAAVVALGLNAAAYMAEIYRAGIDSVHGGQREAALSLGMTRCRRSGSSSCRRRGASSCHPARISGSRCSKDTSLASAIATPELMSRAYDLVGQTWRPMPIYIVVALMYLAMCLPLGQLVHRLERSVKRERRARVAAASDAMAPAGQRRVVPYNKPGGTRCTLRCLRSGRS